ncbi:hypothetical protein COEREDRAFT_7652 [Coemansia reversa NRRL 1564]|uniref:Uncharacterized protein n=1 Tax=Coemansia reversa (strain ATCC 12441 / NRRL 1564) TaxID=763665 RepID=A0A2G5BE75_COERN|nr:hypothetical protein COEREDRAFT_7652 [Coemansia reversa NRRL 1564]|eukprot:PIA17301.1 hypothetical protein COEREDRAFT_7652 [Coemansia reversa NRRL 1564]
MDLPKFVGDVNPDDDIQEWIESIADVCALDSDITDGADMPVEMNGTFTDYSGQHLYFWGVAVPDDGVLPEGDEFTDNRAIFYINVKDNNDIDCPYRSCIE